MRSVIAALRAQLSTSSTIRALALFQTEKQAKIHTLLYYSVVTLNSTPTPSTPAPNSLARIGGGISAMRHFVSNTVFVLLMVIVLAALVASCESVSVPDRAALLINPKGVMVETAHLTDPLTDLFSAGSTQREAELPHILKAIRAATTDNRIHMIVLDLDELQWAAPAHARRIGIALQDFKAAGKKVVSYGYFYAQSPYQIASFADALYMHPMGQVALFGFGGFNLYFKDLLDKFNVNIHVFRVGEFKSAVEPFTRNDMSAQSRMAAEALYQNLWQNTLDTISTNRRLEPAQIQYYADQLDEAVKLTQGDLARAALENHLVDELLTADQARVRMADDVGLAVNGDINSIDYITYLSATDLSPFDDATSAGDKVAVIIAQGVIVASDSDQNVIAADPTIELIRQAKRDPTIKALVLRVDSPGGSQFASEIIRQELELVQMAGKPVVASFGASATSGGYWISATADHIVAESTTITGSIGIFAVTTTFEKVLEDIGVHPDGVGTTALTLAMSPFGGLSETMTNILQSQVEHGYEQFINLVARGRNLTPEEVGAIAQGRVWSGEVAQELGLVDTLGGLDAAVQQAAALAEIDEWATIQLAREPDPRQVLLAQLLSAKIFAGLFSTTAATNSPGQRFKDQVLSALDVIDQLDDPMQTYAICSACVALPGAVQDQSGLLRLLQ